MNAIHVTDEEESVPVIDSVYQLGKVEVRNHDAPTDPFAATGEELRNLSGTSRGVKRKITNEIQKYHRAADDHSVTSKDISDYFEGSGYDYFGVVNPPYDLETFARTYELAPAHYGAIEAKVANIVGLGWSLTESNKTSRALEDLEGDQEKIKKIRRKLARAQQDLAEQIDNFNEEATFTETLINVWRDYEVTGNGYIEIGRKADGSIGYVGHIPATSIRLRRERDGFVQIIANKVAFFRNFGDDVPNPIGDDQNPNEIIHIKRYSPNGGSYYGVPTIIAAQHAVVGNQMAAAFNMEFFENKAVPRYLITLKGANLGTSAQSDLLQFFETGLKGQNHRSLFIPLPSDDGANKVEFKIEPVDAQIQDSSFRGYHDINQNEILMVHRVPITKISLSSNASLALAQDADKTFKEQVCRPEQQILEKKLNRIIKELTDAFELKLNEMTLTDEKTQSDIDVNMVKNGVTTPNEVRVRRGMPALKGGEKLVDLSKPQGNNSRSPAAQVKNNAQPRSRDTARSANASDSQGTARAPKGEGRQAP